MSRTTARLGSYIIYLPLSNESYVLLAPSFCSKMLPGSPLGNAPLLVRRRDSCLFHDQSDASVVDRHTRMRRSVVVSNVTLDGLVEINLDIPLKSGLGPHRSA